MSKNCNAKVSVANFSSPDENMVMLSEDFFSKTLILAFEVIVQSPKHTFEIRIFCRILAHCDSLCHGGTTRMKINSYFHVNEF